MTEIAESGEEDLPFYVLMFLFALAPASPIFRFKLLASYAPARSLDDTLSPFVDAFLLDIIGCHQKHCSQEVRVDIIVFVVAAAG